jgi:CO/xanthine dehydrogenase FAD-binding subunit
MITAYHRPETLQEALQLLARGSSKTAVLAGKTITDASLDDSIDTVVDLQAIGLHQIHTDGTLHRLEALVPLQTWQDSPTTPAALRDIIHAEDSFTFRNMRTIASLLYVPDAESQLLAALLACGAVVQVASSTGTQHLALTDFLVQSATLLRTSIPTAVIVDTSGRIAFANVARTPADKPIVAAVARQTPDGQIRLALSGVAATPILLAPNDVENIKPVGDFRGSSAYRRQMAITLSRRVLDALG